MAKRTKAPLEICLLLALLSTLFLLNGCAASGSVAPTPTPWPTPVVVQQATYTVQRGDVVDSFKLDGRVSPVEWEPLFYKVDGKLTVLNVSEGQTVKKGDVLAELDAKVLNDQLAQAKLTLDQAQSAASQSDSSRKYALQKAQLNLQLQQLALQKLQRSVEQSGPLQKDQAALELEKARVALERAQAAYDPVADKPNIGALPQSAALQSATLDYQLAQIKYKLSQAGDSDVQLQTQQIQVQLAQLAVQELEDKLAISGDVTKVQMQVDSLQSQINDRRLVAPYDGIVAAIGINLQGLTRGFAQRPKVGDNIPAYAALIVLAKPQPLEITVDGTQKRVSELYIGQPVTLTHSAWTRPFVAEVTALPVAMSATGNQPTGSQAVRIALPTNAPPMANGDPVQVFVQSAVHQNTLFLPPLAVRRFAGRAFVVVQDGDRQRRIDITTDLENETRIEIVSGLNEGTVVIGP